MSKFTKDLCLIYCLIFWLSIRPSCHNCVNISPLRNAHSPLRVSLLLSLGVVAKRFMVQVWHFFKCIKL